MLKQRREKQQQMELVIMEQMVPEDHFLRKVDRAVDFSFIYLTCSAVCSISSVRYWLSVLGYVTSFFSYKLCVKSNVSFAV